jgi:hypothetical protein
VRLTPHECTQQLRVPGERGQTPQDRLPLPGGFCGGLGQSSDIRLDEPFVLGAFGTLPGQAQVERLFENGGCRLPAPTREILEVRGASNGGHVSIRELPAEGGSADLLQLVSVALLGLEENRGLSLLRSMMS